MRPFFNEFDPRQEMQRSDFEIFHSKDTHLDSVGLHHHDFYEVYFFISGKVEYQVEGRLYHLLPGDVLLLSPMELHQVTVLTGRVPYERIVLWVSRTFLASLGDDDLLSRCFDNALSEHTNLLRAYERAQVQNLFIHLQEEFANDLYASQVCAQGYLIQLLVLLNRLSMSKQSKVAESDPLISFTVEYINHHYPEELTLDILSAQLNVSKYYLCHEFKRVTGTSIYRYLLLKRLQAARELILQGYPPGNAATKCGFSNYPNFYRSFKSCYGISPSDCLTHSKKL